jgi:hypothetical protein
VSPRRVNESTGCLNPFRVLRQAQDERKKLETREKHPCMSLSKHSGPFVSNLLVYIDILKWFRDRLFFSLFEQFLKFRLQHL